MSSNPQSFISLLTSHTKKYIALWYANRIPASEQDVYFPIHYVHPPTTEYNQAILEMDLNSFSNTREDIAEAFETFAPVMGDRFQIDSDEEGEEEAVESVIGNLRLRLDRRKQDLDGDHIGIKMIEAIKAVEAGMQAKDLELYQAVIGNAKTIIVADKDLREKFGRIKVLPGSKDSRLRVDLLQEFLNDAMEKFDQTQDAKAEN